MNFVLTNVTNLVPLTSVSALALAVLGAIALILYLSLRYPDRCAGTSSNKDIPGPNGLPLVGNLLQMIRRRDNFLGWMSSMEDEYGPLFTYTVPGYGRAIIVNHVQWVEHIKKGDMVSYGKTPHIAAVLREFLGRVNPLVTDGETWRWTRKVVGNVLTYKSFDEHVTRAVSQVLPLAVETLSNVAAQDIVIDWNAFAGRLGVAVFFRFAFRVDAESLTADPRCLTTPKEILEMVRICNNISASRLHNPLWRVTEKFDGRGKQFSDARGKIFKIFDDIIDERLQQQAKGEGEADDTRDFLAEVLRNISDKQVARESMLAQFFAAQDNLQNLLGWTLYELTRNPEWMQRMREESQTNNPTGAVLDYNDLKHYPVHIAIFHEVLRLWPGVPRNSRIAMVDDVLPAIPSLGYGPVKIAKGDSLIWSDRVIMRRTDVWGPDASVFNPGRHLDDKGLFVKPPQPKFHAFGCGPRLCPGSSLAMYQFVVTWATLLPLFDIVPVENKERQMMNGVTSTMDGSFMVRVRTL